MLLPYSLFRNFPGIFYILEPEDVILELATAAQEVSDSLKPEDEFDKYKGRKGDENGGATARATLMDEEVEDDGM